MIGTGVGGLTAIGAGRSSLGRSVRSPANATATTIAASSLGGLVGGEIGGAIGGIAGDGGRRIGSLGGSSLEA